MTVHLKRDVILRDIQHLAKALTSAATLRNRLCAKEKHSVWNILGICQCGGQVLFEAVAIWKEGAIISWGTNLDDLACPHCIADLSRHTTAYHTVHSHKN